MCGMSVDPKNAQFKSEYQGNTYYFCSGMCKTSFDKDPVKYVKGGPGPTMHTPRYDP